MHAVAAAMRRFPALIGAGFIAVLACGLYLPFLGNPPVFDDEAFFSGWKFSYYATHLFGLDLRVPPYFSLAVVQIAWGSIEAHRIVSLAFHVACGLALYKLIFDIQRYTERQTGAPAPATLEAHMPAFVGAALFVLHPVAVYGAAYLIQRMTLFATLFSLISIILYLRGLARRSHADAVSAAALYSIAVLSKETAVLLPAVAVVGGLIVAAERRFMLRHAAFYLVCCAPAALLVTALVKGKIAATEEPHFEVVTAQIAQAGVPLLLESPWVESVITQSGLFFRYLALWAFPDSGAMAIDLRTHFAGAWSPAVTVLAVLGFAGYGLLGAFLVWRGGWARMAGFGMLFPWILFLTEFATIRFQEPFVLYRSYLWAPGLMVVLAAGLARLPGRAVVAAALLAVPFLAYQAHDRLRTFTSGLALWEDAAEKLPRQAIPGGSRTLYNLGREYLYREQPDRAAEIAERCLREYSATYDCHYARAAIHLHLEQYREALPHLARAIALRPQYGAARHNLGIALENLGCITEAKEQYRLAIKLNFVGASHSLSRLESPGSGLLAPAKSKPAKKRAAVGPCPGGAPAG